MDLVQILIGLAGGAVGGNIMGGLMKSSMGTMGRSLTGIIGGTGLAAIGPMIPGVDGFFEAAKESADAAAEDAANGSFNLPGALASLGLGAGGGGILTVILGMLKK